MKVSYRWLKDYINIDLGVKELERELTFSGIEVESVEEIGAVLKQIKVAEIKERKQHPDSDHLSICQVDDGKEMVQVICGAPNCTAGSKVAFAPVGTDLGELEIKKAKIRGEYSFGMLCSERELGISDNHDGIMILSENLETGTTLDKYYQIYDTIFDVEITPNRPDLLGIAGIARDLSALLHKELTLPSPQLNTQGENIEKVLSLDNQAPELCPRYTARVIKGIKIAESPQWLKNRLKAVGLRPINNVVDATNFVMYELGHPLHAFDYHLVSEQKIVIRRAIDGEEFTDLNAVVHKLINDDLVIADPQKAIALAGVIGAANSQITADTQDIIIEAANFKYSSVRKTSKRLAVFTDSAYRFERDLSDEQAELASRRCCEIILQTAGGTLCEGLLDSYPNPEPAKRVPLRPSRITKVLSITLQPEQIRYYLESLGLKLLETSADSMLFEIPPYRKDLTREIDLIEEIIRLYGYNKVETYFQPQKVMDYDIFRSRRKVADTLVKMGFYEVVNWSFSDPDDLDKLRLAENDKRRDTVALKNPLGSSFAIMRPLLLPDILRNTALNLSHNQKDLKLFELNRVYYRSKGKLAEENYHLSGIMTGLRNTTHWREQAETVDFYDVKGVIEELLLVLRLKDYRIENSGENWFQPGTAIDVIWRDMRIGSAGKIDPKVTARYDIEPACYAFDLYLTDIYAEERNLLPVYEEIVKYPPVLRDLSFLIDSRHDLCSIMEVMRRTNPKMIKEIILFDEYKGKTIPSGKRSLTFSLTFSSKQKTLNDKITGKMMDTIIRELEKNFDIKMR